MYQKITLTSNHYHFDKRQSYVVAQRFCWQQTILYYTRSNTEDAYGEQQTNLVEKGGDYFKPHIVFNWLPL